ncbi:AraC family transcriptional regulator, partial [Mesorhizobium sp.]|uniref:helix-turn-helix domain-containing protein n=1 Tax=Mesorhizobium sp. TaxID=1871066 RepID=UPI0011F99449
EHRPSCRSPKGAVGTPLTLQRRLDEQGLMLRDLVDAKRKAVSIDLLEKSDYGLADIAMILGYSEVSAFVRAFTRWTGMPPKAYRVHWRDEALPMRETA